MSNSSSTLLKISPEQLQTLHKPAPRYTSYPTAPAWERLDSLNYSARLKALPKVPLSLYFHIPFCETMCLFCGCSVILNRKKENEERYVAALMQEIDLITSIIGKKREVAQLHFGGGTPTKLSSDLLTLLFEKINSSFEIDFSKEVAIEIDPRTVHSDQGEKLRLLRNLGFNRVSFGVQDTDPKVQEAIRRNQSLEVTETTFHLARELGFDEINIDLIYGLPYQTIVTFKKTVEDILNLRPDRIALFSYAKVPWLKPHQKAMKEETMPSTEEKFQIYAEARTRFIEAGYVAIGMDHFALENNELTKSYHNKTLCRNFQGYSVGRSDTLLGFGVTAIGYLPELYVQNVKELKLYYELIEQGQLPSTRGKILTDDDKIRKWTIHHLMCTFELSKWDFQRNFGVSFDAYFSTSQESLLALESQGLLENRAEKIVVTTLGELFVRNIAMLFDNYLPKNDTTPKFSQSI